jgi:hypothetical protein
MQEIIALIHLCEHLKSVGVNISKFRFYEELTQSSTEETQSSTEVKALCSSVVL